MKIKIEGKNRKHEEEVFDLLRKYTNNYFEGISMVVEDDSDYKY